MAVGSRIDKALRTSHLNKGVALSPNVRYWPNAVISEHEIKRLPNVRFFAKKIFAPRNQFPIGALRNPNINQIVRPK